MSYIPACRGLVFLLWLFRFLLVMDFQCWAGPDRSSSHLPPALNREDVGVALAGRGPDEGAALTSFPSTTGEQPAEGDRFIHEPDLTLMQRADCECPLPLCAPLGVHSRTRPASPLPAPPSPPSLSPKLRHRASVSSSFPVIVAEVTQPSLGVGYEVGRAEAFNKRILCLIRRKSGQGEQPSPGWPRPPPPAEHPALSALSWAE